MQVKSPCMTQNFSANNPPPDDGLFLVLKILLLMAAVIVIFLRARVVFGAVSESAVAAMTKAIREPKLERFDMPAPRDSS